MINKKIEELLKPTVEGLGYELWACEYLAQGKHSILRVYIDKDGGINLSDCETVSHQLSVLLDVEEPISGHYSLEVSSPGLERPLFTVKHFEDYCGSDVFIKLRAGVNNSKKWQGKINKVSDGEVILEVKEDLVTISLDNIMKANLVG